MSNLKKAEKIDKTDDYSWWKVHKKHWKNKIILFLIQLIENFRRIKWNTSKKVIQEFMFVVIIIVCLLVFFYFVLLIVGLLK